MCSKYRQPHRDLGADSERALNSNLAAVQIDAAFHQHQAEPGAGSTGHVVPAVKRVEEPALVFSANPDAAIAHHTDSLRALPFDDELDRSPCLGILHGIVQ